MLAPSPPLPETANVSTRGTHRGRLFRKYLLLILTLVTGALLASGAITIYFTYQETKAAFLNAKRGQAWFGPVYFRKETEPYMTIAIRSGGDKGPVTVAEVNLKFIWDVVS